MHADGSEPHGDCRNYAWDSSLGAAGGRLVLVSDGGIFARVQPRSGGGNAEWVSLNGDIQEMEYLSAHYDNREDRFVAGAQDNAAQVFPRNAKPTDVATGFVDGDGTVTLVDNVHNPARLYGTTQFLGVGSIDIDPSRRRQRRRRRRRGDDGDGDDDEDCGGLCFAQADNKTGVDKYIGVPLDTNFPDPASFPYFVQPMASKSEIRTHVVVPDRARTWLCSTTLSQHHQFTRAARNLSTLMFSPMGISRSLWFRLHSFCQQLHALTLFSFYVLIVGPRVLCFFCRR